MVVLNHFKLLVMIFYHVYCFFYLRCWLGGGSQLSTKCLCMDFLYKKKSVLICASQYPILLSATKLLLNIKAAA